MHVTRGVDQFADRVMLVAGEAEPRRAAAELGRVVRRMGIMTGQALSLSNRFVDVALRFQAVLDVFVANLAQVLWGRDEQFGMPR